MENTCCAPLSDEDAGRDNSNINRRSDRAGRPDATASRYGRERRRDGRSMADAGAGCKENPPWAKRVLDWKLKIR